LENAPDTNAKLAAGLPAASLLMFAVIIFQFNSFRRAIIVFMSVPLIIVGVPFGLLLLGQPMSFFGTLGLISLAGIIINNAIVLIDQIDIEAQSLPIDKAIVAAATKRLRPILLTSATTVIGLMPLYLFGGALWTPLAVVMMSGLAVASLLTLLFVPASYRLLFRDT
jgi:multidrug efflux pump subunit AcrB